MTDTPNEREAQVNRVIAEILEAQRLGQAVDPAVWIEKHPDLAAELRSFFDDAACFQRLAEPIRPARTPPAEAATLGHEPDAPTAGDAEDLHGSGPLGTVKYFGDYELQEEIARGGMGVVYKARQVSLNRIVALKMILSGHLASAAEVQRFYTEARIAANLHHANIVPIYEVGAHDGQHYFSMEYVEGRSLAELVRDSPLPPERAAGYVRAIALAIHYAHQQGTLHRDLKPSNVLIDRFDQPRVTDFGLAKQLEREAESAEREAQSAEGASAGAPRSALRALTQTGAVLGTPGYMSPEQASADRGKVGPLSDVYSLGAVLYELVTGRPPFRAATPLDTLLQVLHEEPAPPRLLNPQISRDLETIILKCLAKAPARRYAGMAALAEDLQRYLNHEPIKARRPRLIERLIRWSGQQRKSVRVAAVATVMTVALSVFGFFAWRSYEESQLGWLMLTTEGPALTAELLENERDELLQTFTVPMQQPLALRGGWYRVRLSGPGRLSEVYQVLVEQGVYSSFTIGPSDRQLWEWETPKGHDVFQFASLEMTGGAGRTNDVILVLLGPGAPPALGDAWFRPIVIQRIDGATGRKVWERSLDRKEQPALAPTGLWFGDIVSGDRSKSLAVIYEEELLRPAPDLDGDGIGDLVWALMINKHGQGRKGLCLLAVSGKDGTVLWCSIPKIQDPEKFDWRWACPPLVADVDGDGLPDLVTVAAMKWRLNPESTGGTALFQTKTRVEAISGRSGQSLWRFELPWQTNSLVLRNQMRAIQAVTLLPLPWPNGLPCLLGLASPDEPSPYDTPVDSSILRYAAALNRAGPKPIVVVGAYKTLVGLDLRTGQLAWPMHNLHLPVLDLAPDGRSALIGGAPARNLAIACMLSATGKTVWEKKEGIGVTGGSVTFHGSFAPLPMIEDLNGDGEPEAVFPWQALDGGSGNNRWVPKRVTRANWDTYQDSSRWSRVIGPDVNGDGFRDVFTVTKISPVQNSFEQQSLRFEIASGSDGLLLGRGQHSLEGLILPSFHWLNLGPREPPRMVLTYQIKEKGYGAASHHTAILTESGRLEHLWPAIDTVKAADLNGDGIPDYLGMRKDRTRLYAVRGGPPELWGRLGSWQPAIHGDIVRQTRSFTMPYVVPPLPFGDLDGDGVGDVLRFQPQDHSGRPDAPLKAYSGKTGRRLWQVENRALGLDEKEHVAYCVLLDCRDLDGDGHAEVLFICGTGQFGVTDSGPILALISGKNGRVRWTARLHTSILSPPGIADVNGDGVADLIFEHSGRHELVAVNGRDGSVLWRRPQKRRGDIKGSIPQDTAFIDLGRPSWFIPVRFDLNGDGKDDEIRYTLDKVQAIDGHSGKLLWEWPRLAGIHDIQPATAERNAVVVLKSGPSFTLYGLDGQTGRCQWRCDASTYPTRDLLMALLPGDGTGRPPSVLCYPRYEIEPWNISVCIQALPTEPDGSVMLTDLIPPTGDLRWIMPLPWEHAARQRLAHALWPSFACLGLLLTFVLIRRWWIVAVLLAFLLVVPWLYGQIQLNATQTFEDERFDWTGWYRLWPYALTGWAEWSWLGNPLVWMAGLLGVTSVCRLMRNRIRRKDHEASAS